MIIIIIIIIIVITTHKNNTLIKDSLYDISYTNIAPSASR